jgi:hypothetical protein
MKRIIPASLILFLLTILFSLAALAVPPIENVRVTNEPFSRAMFRADSSPSSGRYNRTITLIGESAIDSSGVFLQQKNGAIRFKVTGGSTPKFKVVAVAGYYPPSGTPVMAREDSVSHTTKGVKTWEYLINPCLHGYFVFQATAGNDTTIISDMVITTEN